MTIEQFPPPGDFMLAWAGDTIEVTLSLGGVGVGKAFFRTDMSQNGSWTDIPMPQTAPGVYSVSLDLAKTGVFDGKACFFEKGSRLPLWPEGGNLRIKVLGRSVRSRNSIYTVFPRQYGSFRAVARRLDVIMDKMGFRIVQTLPPFPVPTGYAVMGEYGCPFAATDFMSVDPAMAEFDTSTTPLDQFKELISAVHARKGLFFIDLPANHTGWGSTLQTHHPEWFARNADGTFRSPGAWGVVWEDLVELDYSNEELTRYMAGIFLFWCRNGVDGFRCDAGYMIPAASWREIVRTVRREYPETVFMLEGLGGDPAVTDALLADAGLDWAYSEIFQTYDRAAFEWYLPKAMERSAKFGTLVNFAETHDNDRLACRGHVYARLRVQLAALLSFQGAWGIANGVEYYATEKIDVHGKNDLRLDAQPDMVGLIGKLNAVLSRYATFSGAVSPKLITRGDGNTLAVARDRDVLVLANLDCERASTVDFDRNVFAAPEATDALTGRKFSISRPVELSPGEVLCLVTPDARPACAEVRDTGERAFFRWNYPLDTRRVFSAPEGEKFEISASSPFRFTLVDPSSSMTLAAGVSEPDNTALTRMPPYVGDGTFCRRLRLEIEVYRDDGRIERGGSEVLVTPPVAKARLLRVLGADVLARRASDRAVLVNGAGAVAQVRARWGTIASQYDAFLSANPDPECPSDRINLWARTRMWLQHDGYSHEFSMACQTAFSASPGGECAVWSFRVPCGLGRNAEFEVSLSLAEGRNAARLLVKRIHARGKDVAGPVRLVIRPDIEWRSYHETTKAFKGAEGLFPQRVAFTGDSFVFSPYETRFTMRAEGLRFNEEPEWTYNVPHSEEAERGQSDCGDLFSPGWLEGDFLQGESVELVASYGDALDVSPRWRGGAGDTVPASMPLKDALRKAMDAFIVRRNDLKTVIAGYPWFLDWGRDTFIFMRGMMAAGMYADALKILRSFALFERKGTLPNIIYGRTAGNRDTVDAPLWFVRCVAEIENYVPAAELVDLRATSVSIVENYIKGTPNGIKVDPESALVRSPAHFTWMDTNYPACTPREGYAVEVQALWVSALRYLKRGAMADKATESIKKYFKTENGYGDCLEAHGDVPASGAVLDRSVRPNQLFLVTLGVMPDDPSPVEATLPLLVPGSIRSLSADDPGYAGRYTGDEDTSRKPAYHNGTAWAWVFPTFVEAAWMTECVKSHAALSMLASCVEMLNCGCIGQICEISDGDAPHAQKGCSAQAWSVSELVRVMHVVSGRHG